MEVQNDASACSKRLAAALRERRVGEHQQRLALPEHGRMGVARHQMKPLVDWRQRSTGREWTSWTALAVVGSLAFLVLFIADHGMKVGMERLSRCKFSRHLRSRSFAMNMSGEVFSLLL